MDAGDPCACIHMNRRTNRRLAAASFLILMLAVVPGMAYTGAWSGPEGDVQVIVPTDTGEHHHGADGHSHAGGIQECRVGPSKCTGQPSFVSATRLDGEDWAIVPPTFSHAIFGHDHDLAFDAPVYRMKPPPREA